MTNYYDIININEYTFLTMIDNVYSLVDLKKKKNIILPEYTVIIEPTRIYWKNAHAFLLTLNRNYEHLLNFLKNELNNIDINWVSTQSLDDGLIIHQKYPKIKILKEVINKYIDNYVICSSCNSSNTLLNKFILKKYQFTCNECGMNKCI